MQLFKRVSRKSIRPDSRKIDLILSEHNKLYKDKMSLAWTPLSTTIINSTTL